MSKSEKYIQLNELDHILQRPDTLIGSISTNKIDQWIYNKKTDKINKQNINFNEGLIRLFLEILSNAIDNGPRSKKFKQKMTYIDINIDKLSGEITISNDGYGIPIEKTIDINGKEIYIPTLIFGRLRTGSNFNDDDERITSGRNGYGGKLASIFSTTFKVNICTDNICFEQIFTNNMKEESKPKIKTTKNKKNSITITYIADFKLFGLTKYTSDIINYFKKLAIDTAMIVDCNVSFNDDYIGNLDIKQYSEYYFENDYNYIQLDESCILCESIHEYSEYNQMSFVNGINTTLGGVHVDFYLNKINDTVSSKINKLKKNSKDKKIIDNNTIKKYFFLFVNVTLINPSFTSQTKEKLANPKLNYIVSQTKLNKILKWDFYNELEELKSYKEKKALSKTDGKKSTNVLIDKLTDANLAGTKDSNLCTLILTEGLSASKFAITGTSILNDKKGRDYYGIYPLKGKLLNTEISTINKINNNKEICDIKQILGLKYNVDYTIDKNRKSLRYNDVRILCDPDVDGGHITGLIINFFNDEYPSLLKCNNFLYNMKTPIIIINKKNKFYNEIDYKKYITKYPNTKSKTIKYYKGLGTYTTEEEKEEFRNPNLIQFIYDDTTNLSIKNIFGKNKSDNIKILINKIKN